MSQLPPSTPDSSGHDAILPNVGIPRSTTLARAAMALGIVSVVLFFAVFFLSSSAFAYSGLVGVLFAAALAGFGALIFATIALFKISRNPRQHGGKGMALTGIIIVFATIFLFTFILPFLGRARSLGARSTCPSNLRTIMFAMTLYAQENTGSYPYLGPERITAQPPLGDTPGGLMHDMYVLTASGKVLLTPKLFICKSDPATIAFSNVPTVKGPRSYAPTYWTNPDGGDPNFCYSYSFAYQYSRPGALGAWWRNTGDAAVAIAADMNPGTQPAELGAGKHRNSLNHQGDGQNVAFADGHAEFTRTPTCGENNDHIYNTGIANDPTAPGIIGQPPFVSPAGNTQGSFDTCLVPGIADTTNYTRK